MIKPRLLHTHLTAALPRLAQNPELLKMFVVGGNVHATATAALSWEYGYTLQLQFLDWKDHADTVIAPLLVWIKHHQYELLANPDKKGIRFNVEYLNTDCMDLVIDLDLSERVLARAHAEVAGALQLHHLDDTPPLYMPVPERWSIYIKGDKVAEWDYEASPPPVTGS